jgi:hypothetical protein
MILTANSSSGCRQLCRFCNSCDEDITAGPAEKNKKVDI